jgi:glycosyltransferase involved in cell wall biosynthesis
MKIAMVGQKGIPAHSGGVEQHVDMLSRLLTERGHQVTAYCRRSYCDDSPLTTHHSPLTFPRRIFRPSIPTKHLDAITHTVTSTIDVLFRDVDLVHYHAIGPAALAPIARLRGLPTVVTCHGLDWQRAKWGGLAKRCLRLGEWLAARCASRLVVVSEPLREYFASVYGVESAYIPNGVVPIERRAPNRIKHWNLRPGSYLLAASRLVPEKGLHYLIPAFQSLETDLKLVIAGGGGLDQGYEQELRRIAGPRVIFTGNADRESMGELYSNALLFLLPSELEGMSIALLEAMSCGLPVVVSDIPENTRVVGEDGFTFRNRDTDHLREVLASLLEHTEILPEFGERCRVRAERFRWPQVAAELEAVYRSVVEGRPIEPVPLECGGLTPLSIDQRGEPSDPKRCQATALQSSLD